MSAAIGRDAQVLLVPGGLIIRSDRLECFDGKRKSILSRVSPRPSDTGTSRRNLLPEVANSSSQAWILFHSIGAHRTFGLPSLSSDNFPPENTTQEHHYSSVWTLHQFFGLTGNQELFNLDFKKLTEIRIQRVQDGLTMAEQRVLNYLWEQAYNKSSGASRLLTVNQKQVAFATRLSVVSVRSNLRSLEAKRCIEETASFNVTTHLG